MTRTHSPLSRHVWLLAFAASVVVLAACALYLNQSTQRLNQIRVEVSSANQRLADLERERSETEQRAALAGKARELLSDIDRYGLAPEGWGERRLNLRQQRLPRETVDELLRSTIRGPDRLFGAESFDLSVTHVEEGLFSTPPVDGQALQVTLRGTQLFRTREGAQ